jgi:hypothetical protein
MDRFMDRHGRDQPSPGRRRRRVLEAVALVVASLFTGAGRTVFAAVDLPSRLTDEEFWQLPIKGEVSGCVGK